MRQTISLNRKWAFRKGAGDAVPTPTPDWDFVDLPHTWNAIDGQDGGNDYYRGKCWYCKTLAPSEFPKADRYYLEFRGANASADVYLGEQHLAHHDGGYSTFRVEITEPLKTERRLAVAVDNGENDFVYPQTADFTFYGGLYREVRLLAVHNTHFDLDFYGASGIAVTPALHGDAADVKIEVWLQNAAPHHRLRFTVRDAQGATAAQSTVDADNTTVTLTLPAVHRWNGREDPYLYTASAEVLDGDTVLDDVCTHFGCRTFSIDAERGFFLNEKPYPLHGVSRHQDVWRCGNALTAAQHEADIRLIAETGANTVRLAHYQQDAYVYDLCDRYGLVVWAEIPYISRHMPHGTENTQSQLQELILQNYNHPSIVVWGLSNEITIGGVQAGLLENHRLLNDLAHRLDPTRLTALAVVSMCDIHEPYLQIPDVLAFNHYFGWYGGDVSMNGPWFDRFHAEFPDRPVAISEYGCEALNWHTSNPEQGDYTEEYQAYYHEELIKQLFSRPYIWATYVWNMFDFGADARAEGGENGQNHKGLMTFDRRYKKDAFYAYKAWLSKEPFVHICGKRYQKRAEKVTRVTVYSNLPQVELFANGKSLGKQTSDVHFFYFDVPNSGETKLTAVAGDCKDESVLYKVEAFHEAYRLKEKGALLNWFDITAPEGYFSLLDKLSEITATPAGAQLFGTLFSDLQGTGDFAVDENMLKMLGGFTVLRLLNLLGTAGVKLTKEELLEVNAKLNKIKKTV